MTKGVIVIHGLTGTPATMAPLTTRLSQNGFTVISPTLPGHSTTPEDLSKTRWEDWQGHIAECYDELKRKTDDICCAGLSLGSLLTLDLAMDASRPLKKIACLGTPLQLSPLLEKFLLPISHVPPVRQLIRYSKKDWAASVSDRDGLEIYKGTSYDRIPVRSVWQLCELRKRVMAGLPGLKLPILIVHSRKDTVAPPVNVEILQRGARKSHIDVMWLSRSQHVMTLDSEKDAVVEEVSVFFLR